MEKEIVLDNVLISSKDFNVVPEEGILVNINDHSIYSLTDNVLKKDAVIDQLNLYLTEKNWMAVLNNCTIKITELWMREVERLFPVIGPVTDTYITKIKFEVVPEYSILNF